MGALSQLSNTNDRCQQGSPDENDSRFLFCLQMLNIGRTSVILFGTKETEDLHHLRIYEKVPQRGEKKKILMLTVKRYDGLDKR